MAYKSVSEMTYNVWSGMINPTIPLNACAASHIVCRSQISCLDGQKVVRVTSIVILPLTAV